MNRSQQHILDIIKHNIEYNPDALQCYSQSKAQMVSVYQDLILNNKAIFEYENGLVFLFQPFSNYMTQIHLFSYSFTEFVSNAKALTTKVFNKYNYVKLFGISDNKRFITVSKKTGWKLEGNLTNSHVKRDGSLTDQFILSSYRFDYVTSPLYPRY